MFFISLFKCSCWLPYILITTFSFATLKPLYDVTLFCYCIFVFWEHQKSGFSMEICFSSWLFSCPVLGSFYCYISDSVALGVPQIYGFTKFFSGDVGHMHEGLPCYCIMAIIDTVDAVWTFAATAYPSSWIVNNCHFANNVSGLIKYACNNCMSFFVYIGICSGSMILSSHILYFALVLLSCVYYMCFCYSGISCLVSLVLVIFCLPTFLPMCG